MGLKRIVFVSDGCFSCSFGNWMIFREEIVNEPDGMEMPLDFSESLIGLIFLSFEKWFISVELDCVLPMNGSIWSIDWLESDKDAKVKIINY